MKNPISFYRQLRFILQFGDLTSGRNGNNFYFTPHDEYFELFDFENSESIVPYIGANLDQLVTDCFNLLILQHQKHLDKEPF
jgi:hypothetical protein